MPAGRFWNLTVSHCPPPLKRAPRANELRSAPPVHPFGTLCLRYSFCCGRAAGLLAGLFEMALEIPTGSGRGSAARPASNRIGILYVARHGPSRTVGKIVARGV